MSETTTHAAEHPLVLLVDDFEDNREIYAQYLVYRGFRVAEAATGLEAIEQAHTLMPDLIVMDLALPAMDGWEATRRLKDDARTRHIPVIALTGHVFQGHSQRATEVGCDAFVTKPCLPERLIQEIEKLLPRGGAGQDGAGQGGQTSTGRLTGGGEHGDAR